MKLVMAIVNKDDAGRVSQEITKAGFMVTKLATTGGFLQTGNTTFLVGTEEERVDEVIGIVERYSKRRTQIVPGTAFGIGAPTAQPVEVTVGGATVFVVDVERFEKV
jgi:uncharacterized protein YaaQ